MSISLAISARAGVREDSGRRRVGRRRLHNGIVHAIAITTTPVGHCETVWPTPFLCLLFLFAILGAKLSPNVSLRMLMAVVRRVHV